MTQEISASRLDLADRGEKLAPRHCLFIPGMLATNAGMEAELGIGPALAKVYGGTETVTTFNSIVSTDKKDSERFGKMAQVIKEHAASGLDIAVHSLGASELYKVIQSLKREDPTFFEGTEHKKNLHFILIGPSGFSQGLKERFSYPFRALRDAIDTKYSALTAFPSQSVSQDSLTDIFSDISNKRDNIPTVPFENTRTNEGYLRTQERIALTHYDVLLEEAVERQDTQEARRIIKARAKAVRRPLQQVFEGTTVIATGKSSRITIGGRKGLGVLLSAAGKKPMEEMLKLDDMGYQVDLLVPEFDIVKPLRTVVNFLQNKNTSLSVVEGSGHTGFALQPDLYAQAIAETGRKRK